MNLQPESLLAAQLIERAADGPGLIHIARSGARASRLHRAIHALQPDFGAILLPGWDCLPYDRISPSRSVMGARMAAVMAMPGKPRLLLTTASAAMQRLPPPEAMAQLTLRRGETWDLEKLEARLRNLGYLLDERVDEPGEAALRGGVLDIFPAAEEGRPFRAEHVEGRITALRHYDPLTQRSTTEVTEVTLTPASEILGLEDPSMAELPGIEHALARFHARLVTLFDLLPEATLVQEPEVEELWKQRDREVEEAFRTRFALQPAMEEEALPVTEPAALYLDAAARAAALKGRDILRLQEDQESAPSTLPLFRQAEHPEECFLDFVEAERQAGRRVALAGPPRAARALLRLAEERLGQPAVRLSGWLALRQAPVGCFAAIPGGLESSLTTEEACVIALADINPQHLSERRQEATHLAFGEGQLQLGDAVIHSDHGLGALRGIETVSLDGIERDCLRLEYADGATQLVPCNEMDRIWRYGAEAASVSLDRLAGEAWPKRRAAVEEALRQTATMLLQKLHEQQSLKAPALRPSRREMERFGADFPHAPTPDQDAAINAVLHDLASGHAMDRLVCGDVGFGKTEIALRAAAAASLEGHQVALLAPTTVLVRQHLETFRLRFAKMGIQVEMLSRLTGAAEARRVKSGLATGEVGIVVGTQALAGKDVRFQKLGLVIVDEEQRFGTRQKGMLQRLGRGVHKLTLTATPIPRTLQSALIGLQALSVLATPPARRQPIRTLQAPASDALLKESLQREFRRGGQSFVVCPQITDLPTMRSRLRRLLPRLRLIEAHGEMPAEEMDTAIVRFAAGEADLLLSTNIVETGLDVPRANTMIVWRPDRFGLAQLHQLRGRVGRGRARGSIILMTDPQEPPSAAALKRLKTLEAFDRVGAGFSISARDMDLRGAGDLLGETQAGHLRLIGLGLYQHLLEHALRSARGEPSVPEWSPEVSLGVSTTIPSDYVGEDALRVELHVRLGRLLRDGDREQLEAFADEITDRFGPPPPPVRYWLAEAKLRLQCRRLGVRKLEIGPQGGVAQLTGEKLILRQPRQSAEDRLALATKLLVNAKRRLKQQASAA